MAAEEIRAELEDLNAHVTTPGLAAVVIKLAESLDATDAATTQAVVARELNALMKTVRSLAPMSEEGDAVDDLAARRAARRGA